MNPKTVILVSLGGIQKTLDDCIYFLKKSNPDYEIKVITKDPINAPPFQPTTPEFHDFFKNCKNRFWAIYETMKSEDLKNVFHIENDVVVLHSFDKLKFDRSDLTVTKDSLLRAPPAMMYIPTAERLKEFLDNWDDSNNDMFQWRKASAFPLINEDYIVDPAAIGQLLFGINYYVQGPQHKYKPFVNEHSTINYTQFKFSIIGGELCMIYHNGCYSKVFNIHMHCKDLFKIRSLIK